MQLIFYLFENLTAFQIHLILIQWEELNNVSAKNVHESMRVASLHTADCIKFVLHGIPYYLTYSYSTYILWK